MKYISDMLNFKRGQVLYTCLFFMSLLAIIVLNVVYMDVLIRGYMINYIDFLSNIGNK